MTSFNVTVLRAGVAGLGRAGGAILSSLSKLEGVEIVAAADPRPASREQFLREFHGRAYESIEELCDDSGVDAVWVATPTWLHAAHAKLVAERGKHVVVEKPLAVTLLECEQMIDAANRCGVALIAGGCRSFDPAFVAMRRVIDSNRVGPVGALNTWSFSDWMNRPREAWELNVNNGGGIVYRQAPHQVDVLRLLGGGMVRSVRGMTGQWMSARPCPGYFTACLEFEDGTPATLSYDGHGYMSAWELVPWGETPPRREALAVSAAYGRKLRQGDIDESASREARRYGSTPPTSSVGESDWTPSDAGYVVVSCWEGLVRQSANGLYVYDADGRHEEPIEGEGGMRVNELNDLRIAIDREQHPIHDGQWGMATMEVVLAIMESATKHSEIMLHNQVPVVKR